MLGIWDCGLDTYGIETGDTGVSLVWVLTSQESDWPSLPVVVVLGPVWLPATVWTVANGRPVEADRM